MPVMLYFFEEAHLVLPMELFVALDEHELSYIMDHHKSWDLVSCMHCNCKCEEFIDDV
jgi:hypothetical protein